MATLIKLTVNFFIRHFIILFIFQISYASEIDSLEKEILLNMINHDRELETLVQINHLIKKQIHANPKEGIKWGIRALDWASPNNLESKEIADIYNSIGSCFNKSGLFNYANDYYLRGKNLFANLDMKPQVAWTYISIGNVYFKQQLYDLAKSRYQNSLEIFTDLSDTNGIGLTNLNLGLIANELNEIEKANDFIEKSFQLRKNNDVPFIRAETHFYYGLQFLENYDTQSAMEHIKKSIEICADVCGDDLISKYNYQLGLINFEKGNLNIAKSYFLNCLNLTGIHHKLKSHLQTAKILISEQNFEKAENVLLSGLTLATEHNILEVMLEFNEKLYELYVGNKEFEKSIYYLNQIIAIKDSLKNASVIESIAKSEIQLEVENWSHQLELKDIEVEQKNKVINYWIFASILALILIILVLKLYQSEKKHSKLKRKQEKILHEQNLLIKENENKKIADQLDLRKRELTSKSLDIIENDKFISDLENQINLFKKATIPKKQFIDSLNEVIQNKKTHKNAWNEFQLMLVEIYPEFEDKLKMDFPELNQNDIQLCGLLKLGFTSKMISEIRNVSIRAVEQHRYRIRKKMNLEKDAKLPDFLKTIS